MEDQKMRRYVRTAGSWLVADCLFDVYFYFNDLSSNDHRKEVFFNSIFYRYGKEFDHNSSATRMSMLMHLVKEANIYVCLDSIIHSNATSRGFSNTKVKALETKKRFIDRFGSTIPPL